jgi:DNA-binding transcriptional LysR family regulator
MRAEQLPHLETFAKAAELSSFTTAARALGLTQSAVSQRITVLERQLKELLFHRIGRQVRLSEAGHHLYTYSQTIFALHGEAIHAITGRAIPFSGELSVAASSVPGEHLLPELLVQFQKTNLNVRIRASVTDSQNVLNQVEQGKVHLGLVGEKRDCPHLAFECFARDTLVLIAPAEHEWAGKKRVTIAQVAQEPFIVREAGSGSRACLEKALAKAGKSLLDLDVALELGSNEAIIGAVRRGIGVAVLSTRAIAKAGTLCALRIKGLDLSREICVTWDKRRVLSMPERLFRDFLALQKLAKKGE